jgi:transposase, IS30 family
MKKYCRVTAEDRLAIERGLKAGLPKNAIARNLGFHPSSVGREINRNSGKRGYRPKQAQRKALKRQEFRFEARKMTPEMQGDLNRLLAKRWSPEQIKGRLEREGKDSVSHETIYQYIYRDRQEGGELWRALRRAHRRRKPRFPRIDGRGKIPGVVSIEKRSVKAARRERLGDWERDSMLGKQEKGGVLVIVDRKSRFTKMVKLEEKKAVLITEATMKLLKGMPVETVTNDNGHEFADHMTLAKKLKVPVYFCHPYSPQERGSNENRIGLIRQYMPKGIALKNFSDDFVKEVELELNTRPMKCLDWRTPYEVLYKKEVALTT